MGGALVAEVLEQIPGLQPTPQPEHGVTYASKIEKNEAHLDFDAPAIEIERRVRAFAPTPGAYFETAGNRVKILSAEIVEGSGAAGTVIDDDLTIACGEGAIAPGLVQRQGRAPMSPGELLRGFPIPSGTRLE
jgi:methionyl-tRNA formyltransferase